jgi:hypothetical protein
VSHCICLLRILPLSFSLHRRYNLVKSKLASLQGYVSELSGVIRSKNPSLFLTLQSRKQQQQQQQQPQGGGGGGIGLGMGGGSNGNGGYPPQQQQHSGGRGDPMMMNYSGVSSIGTHRPGGRR